MFFVIFIFNSLTLVLNIIFISKKSYVFAYTNFFFLTSSQWNDCRLLLITKLTTFFASSTFYHMPIFHRSLFKFMRSDIVEMTSQSGFGSSFYFVKITSSSVLMDDILSWLTQQNHTRSITGERMYQACRQVSVKTITHHPCIGNIMIIITEMP